MQTFLPYPNFRQSASVLDWRRLGKQRVEAYQLLLAMNNPLQKGWKNHPAYLIWQGHDVQLALYAISMCDEWTDRGYKDTTRNKILSVLETSKYKNYDLPPIFGREDYHSSHRAALLKKQYDHYSQFGWTEEPIQNYVWI